MALVISSKAHKYKSTEPHKTDNGNRAEMNYSVNPSAGVAKPEVDSFSHILEKQINDQRNLDGLDNSRGETSVHVLDASKSGTPSVSIEGVFLTSINQRYRYQFSQRLDLVSNPIKVKRVVNADVLNRGINFGTENTSMSQLNFEAVIHSNPKSEDDKLRLFTKYDFEKQPTVFMSVQANSRYRSALQLLMG